MCGVCWSETGLMKSKLDALKLGLYVQKESSMTMLSLGALLLSGVVTSASLSVPVVDAEVDVDAESAIISRLTCALGRRLEGELLADLVILPLKTPKICECGA